MNNDQVNLPGYSNVNSTEYGTKFSPTNYTPRNTTTPNTIVVHPENINNKKRVRQIIIIGGIIFLMAIRNFII
ncbi:hypothetical protein A3Q56_05092 [Intoshia linei]|uniref:Uncharacterized protein n=1 Tax=Intoshia linei TaxID=1819745 RepID=A0A177AYV2_9BILA|nr:hypothetical protein A3Q56_05092 [Intoshia linei]